MLALDTDVLASFLMEGAATHKAARVLVEGEIARRRGRIVLVPQVLYEMLHVVTDKSRFEKPMPMSDALDRARDLWNGREVVRIVPGPPVIQRAIDLMRSLHLGRKRILDTVLAATLESSGVRRLATGNGRDYAVFPFLEVVAPR